MRESLPVLMLVVGGLVSRAEQVPERAELARLDQEAKSLVQTWLNSNCGAGDSKLAARIERLGARLEPVLLEAYRLGPTDTEVKKLGDALPLRYAERRRTLKESGERLFGKEETERLLRMTEREYSEREMKLYTERFKGQALNGLGLVGTRKSEEELKRIANNQHHPLQITAREALKGLQKRK